MGIRYMKTFIEVLRLCWKRFSKNIYSSTMAMCTKR